MGTTDKTSQTTQANSTKPNGLIYGLNDRPPLRETLFAGCDNWTDKRKTGALNTQQATTDFT